MEFNVLKLFCVAVIWFEFHTLVIGLSVLGKQPLQEKPELDENNGNTKSSSFLSSKCDPCPEGILCVPQIQCPAHILMGNHEKPQTCDLSGGKFGFCCLTGQNHSVYQKDKERFLGFPSLSDTIIEEARAKFALLMKNAVGAVVQRGHPDFLHNMVFHSNADEDIESFQISASAMEEVITSQIFREKLYFSQVEIVTFRIEM